MMSIANLKIGTRLTMGFGAVIALLVLVAVIGVTRLRAVNDDTEVILHDRFVKVRLAQTVENEVNKQLGALRTALIVTDPQLLASELALLETSMGVVAKAIDQLAASVHGARSQSSFQQVVTSRAAFKEKEVKLIAAIKAGRLDEGRSLLVSELMPLQTAYVKAIEDFADTQVDSMEEFGSHATQIARNAELTMEVLAVVALVLASLITQLLKRSITRPIAEAVRLAETVAAGDLTSTITVHSGDETGQLLGALGAMNDSLVRIVQQVRQSSEFIATGSRQIATGGADLSHRTEEQAASLEETAAAMEELTEAVQRSADSARGASALAASASEVATKGGSVVAEVIATMREISSSSSKIADITGVIDGIAFQTNILALNAAVEAARAGEHGRGFAVVAGEVRTLAQRAATAAKEIKALIGASVGRVEAGAKLVEGAGGTMDEIVHQVQSVAGLIADIGMATEQQSQGIGEVSKAIHQLDQVTQQNASLVEESAAAADSLSQQARNLAELVGTFRLTERL